MRLSPYKRLSDSQVNTWCAALDDAQVGGPHQLPYYLDWWQGLVPGTSWGGYLTLGDEPWRAFGAFFLRLGGPVPVVEFPRGPVAQTKADLLDFLELLPTAFPGYQIVISPYAIASEPDITAVSNRGFLDIRRRWTENTIRIDLTDPVGPLSTQARRNVTKAIAAGATVAQDHSPEILRWFAEEQSRVAASRGFEATPLTYLQRACSQRRSDGLNCAQLFTMIANGQVVAGALILRTGRIAHLQKAYSIGARMGSQYLHLQIARILSEDGVQYYDLGGIEEGPGLHGLARFKRGLGLPAHLYPAFAHSPRTRMESL